MELSPDRKEIIRYLGYHGVSPDEEVLREIELCVEQLQKAVTPRYVYEKFPLSRSRGQNSEEQLCFAGITVTSRNLSAKNNYVLPALRSRAEICPRICRGAALFI